MKKPKINKKILKRDKTNKPKRIAFLWFHLARAWQDVTIFWRSMIGVVAVYAVTYIVTVIGLNFVIPSLSSVGTTSPDTAIQNSGALDKSFSAISKSFSFVNGDQSSTLVQILLFLVASLAFVWTLRKIKQLKRVKISEAYYNGTAQIVALFLLCLWYLAYLIPIAIGTAIISIASYSSSLVESIVIFGLFGMLTWLTLWLYSIYWPAFYIITLPNMRPMKALHSAKKITKANRLNISIQVVGYIMLVVIVGIIVLLPIALILPPVTPYIFLVYVFVLFGYSHTFMFAIYRSLIGEK